MNQISAEQMDRELRQLKQEVKDFDGPCEICGVNKAEDALGPKLQIEGIKHICVPCRSIVQNQYMAIQAKQAVNRDDEMKEIIRMMKRDGVPAEKDLLE